MEVASGRVRNGLVLTQRTRLRPVLVVGANSARQSIGVGSAWLTSKPQSRSAKRLFAGVVLGVDYSRLFQKENPVSFMPEVQTEPARLSEVAGERQRIEETANYIEKLTEELEATLSQSILAQSKTGSGASEKNPEPVRVPLAQSLYEHGLQLERIRERLSSILSRIEA